MKATIVIVILLGVIWTPNIPEDCDDTKYNCCPIPMLGHFFVTGDPGHYDDCLGFPTSLPGGP